MNGGDYPHQQTGRGLDDTTTSYQSTSKSHGKSSSLHVVVSSHDGDDDDLDDGSDNDTVGSLLADIANAINDALRMLMFADKRHWSSDEFEQVRALEDALDEAKKDFQEMGPLLKGSFYYENDRRRTSYPDLFPPASGLQVNRTSLSHKSCKTPSRSRRIIRSVPPPSRPPRTNKLTLSASPQPNP